MKLKTSIQLLREHGLGPKKSFGQNFLQDVHLCARIAEMATTPVGGTVVEIGAGLGALTRPLLERAATVVAVERDRDLVPILRAELAGFSHLEIVEADAARLDYEAIFRDAGRPRVLAGNLPYQLSGKLLRRAVEVAPLLDLAVFAVQREVAERLAAKPGGGDYGALSVFAQAAFAVELVLKLPASVFVPAPKVASAVVRLTPLRPPVAEETGLFREVVKRAFAQRRKTLRNAWGGLAGVASAQLAAVADEAGIDLGARAETLAVSDFARFARLLESHARTR